MICSIYTTLATFTTIATMLHLLHMLQVLITDNSNIRQALRSKDISDSGQFVLRVLLPFHHVSRLLGHIRGSVGVRVWTGPGQTCLPQVLGKELFS